MEYLGIYGEPLGFFRESLGIYGESLGMHRESLGIYRQPKLDLRLFGAVLKELKRGHCVPYAKSAHLFRARATVQAG